MAHADTQILDAFVARLTTMTTVADSAVTAERVYPYETAELPAIDVAISSSNQVDDEDEEQLSGMMLREIILDVMHRAKLNTGIGDALRAQAVEVVNKIVPTATDHNLGGLVTQVELNGYDLDLSDDTEKPIGLLNQTWSIRYRVLFNDPETIQS